MKKKYTCIPVNLNTPLSRACAQNPGSAIKMKVFKPRLNERTLRNPLESAQLVSVDPLPHFNIRKNIASEDFLSYRLYKKNVTKIIRSYRSAIELENKFKIAYTELRKRLQIDDHPDDIKAVMDTDDSYFQYLNTHRPQYIPVYKSLKHLYHKILYTKQELCYRKDDVFNIEIHYRRQVKEHDSSFQLYMEQLKQFDAFLTEDYEKSMACLVKSQSLAKIIDAKIRELKHLARKQFSVQTKLIAINYLYYQQQKYGRFLYYLSPPNWRVKHRDFACSVEIAAKGFDLGASSEEEVFNVIFENMKRECDSGLVEPALYFSQPEELKNIFELKQNQQLHLFTRVMRLKPYMEMLRNVIYNVKLQIQNDTAFAADVIGNIEKLINFDEIRATSLKAKFMKILFGVFYDSVAAIDVLQLKFYLEFTFEKIFKEKPSISIGATVKALEDMYMAYTYEIDNFGNDEAKTALEESIAEEKQIMLKARMAAKELRLFDRLEKALTRANADSVMAVPAVNRPTRRKLKKQHNEANIKRISQRDLTEAEMEYLNIFTDWAENENPAKYLQSLDISPDTLNIY